MTITCSAFHFLFFLLLFRVHFHRIPLTRFEQHDLVVLRQFHESGHHFGELDDLLYDRRQLLRALQPQFLVGLKRNACILLLHSYCSYTHFAVNGGASKWR